MRRYPFGVFGLALAIFVTPAAAQDTRNSPPQRSAKLGRPVADANTSPPSDSGITPVAGLLRQTHGGMPVPMPMPGDPKGAPPANPGSVLPQPRATPSVVEDRGSSGVAAVPTYPAGVVYQGVPTLVPSVGPDGFGVPQLGQLGLEDPNCGDCAVGGCPAVNRVRGCGRWWASAEYLMWWTRAASLPTLVTTSSPQFNGHLGVGDTRPVLGGSFGQTFHSGGRFAVGRWFGDEQIRGIEGRLFFLGQAASTFTATTGQYPLLARPFFNTNPNTPFFGSDSQVVGDSTRANGGVTVQLENTVWGAEANYRRFLFGDPCIGPCGGYRVDALVGYRYLNMNEKLTITENFVRVPGPIGTGFPATSGTVVDQFRTENHFHGGQIGLTGEIHRGRWSLDGRVAVAFGNLQRTAEITGGQALVLADGTTANVPGGLLAIPGANIGRFTDNVFAAIPEVGVNVGYQLTSRLRMFVGYNFLYMGNALRPAQVIDPAIDAARIPNFLYPNVVAPVAGVAHPTPQFRSSGFFIQGINFGLQFNW